MPKRRRLFTPLKNRSKPPTKIDKDENEVKEMSTARGRLKGALLDVLGPASDESDASSDYVPTKKLSKEQSSEDEEETQRKLSPQRQSYVLKLFDRSVDLSQFSEDSPLYPICRAWIANQPKANYKEFGCYNDRKHEEPKQNAESVDLPGPEGPPVSKIPPLVPEQLAANKDNINLNYRSAPPPNRAELLQEHSERWLSVRRAWQQRAALAEARYDATQQLLNKINVNAM